MHKNKEATLKDSISEIITAHYSKVYQNTERDYEEMLNNILKLISKEIKKNRPKEKKLLKVRAKEWTMEKDIVNAITNENYNHFNQALSEYNKVIADTLK